MRSHTRFGRLAALLLTTIVGLALPQDSAAQRIDRMTLQGHVPAALIGAQAVATDSAAPSQPILITIVLARHDEPGFQRYLADVYNSGSPNFRRFLSPVEVANRFGPRQEAYDAVAAHFIAEGFAPSEGSANRLTLTFRGSRAQAEHALSVRINDYALGGRRFRANDAEPSLPPAIAAHVQAVLGLSDLATPQRVTVAPLYFNACANNSQLDQYTQGFCKDWYKGLYNFGWGLGGLIANFGCLISPLFSLWQKPACTIPNPNPPPDGALGAPARPAPDGAGEVIGLAQFDSYVPGDVANFLALLDAPPGQLAKISSVAVNGGAPLGANQAEVLLDIGAATTIAQGANVVVYSAPFAGMGSFQALFNRMLVDGVSIISNSWAYCEDQTTFADVSSIDSILAAAAASGVSVFSASGDTGSTCLHRAPNTIVVPAGAPHATAVGGTSAKLAPGGVYGSQTWWGATPTTPPGGEGGFGASRFFPRPAWQNGFTSSATRTIPDFSLPSDPSTTGVALCQASAGGCPTGLLYGGTSVAAPMMAGIAALMNTSLGRRVGWLNPQVYPLAGTTAFHSPASMGSDFMHLGIGAPNASLLTLVLKGGIVGAPNPALSLVVASSSEFAANGIDEVKIAVQLRDNQGVTVAGRTVTLTKNPGSNAVITPASAVTSVANGAVVFTVKNATVQNSTFTATDVASGLTISQTVTLAAVVPPATAGGISAFPTTVLNNGTATTTITVTLQDAQSNPTPGKQVTLSQGSGHSIITAPVPAVTDANGQIQFTATNKIAETVTYTAVDVTDGNLPIPGSAVVTFSGQASVSCAGAITPASGFVVTPLATGFVAEAFSYSNINFGCAGGSDPNFTAGGSFYVSGYRTGEFYKLPAEGGAATTANRLSSPGISLGRSVFGKDGKLYAARSATGSGFFSGQVLELDPQTGATLRTLASNLPCVAPLAVDPLSGDLFFTGQCFNFGANDPRLLRISSPGSVSPTLSTYATLPGSPNGAVAFAPDGSMFVAISYLGPTPQVVRVSGTNQPQPPTITTVPGIDAVFWVNIGETLPSGAAKSLIVNTSDQKLRLANITTNPPTFTELLTTGASSGVVGPDACLYISNGETVYRLTTTAGTCGFASTSVAPAIHLTPGTVVPNPLQGSNVTFTAKLVGVSNPAGTPVFFRVSGANAQVRLGVANANGVATLDYTGVLAGNDTVVAEAMPASTLLESNVARVTWGVGNHETYVSLEPSPFSANAGVAVMLSASLRDLSTTGATSAVAGASLQFNVAGQSCNALTNASGIATCPVTIPLTGVYTLTVTYAGNTQLNASTDARLFTVTPVPPPPCAAFNDVDQTSSFCVNVEWIKNRLVTLGCTAFLYCPIDAVIRLQMAAFMNRLGTALSGAVLFEEAQPGALNIDATPVVCQTDDFVTDTFTRRALADGSFSGSGTSDVGFGVDVVATFDGGTTWVPLASVGNRAFAPANHWGHVRASGVADLAAAQTMRFGLAIGRGGLPGSADLTASRCKLRVTVSSR